MSCAYHVHCTAGLATQAGLKVITKIEMQLTAHMLCAAGALLPRIIKQSVDFKPDLIAIMKENSFPTYFLESLAFYLSI